MLRLIPSADHDVDRVTFIGLIAHNLWTKRARTVLTAFAVALGVATVITLGVVTESLRASATAVLETGRADFTIAQKGVNGLLNSAINDSQIARIQKQPGIESVVGALIGLEDLGAANPAFMEIGLTAESLAPFGVRLVNGQAFTDDATDEVLLGWRAADNLGLRVGDSITIAGGPKTIVGVYNTGQSTGDAGAILPLAFFQGEERLTGTVTLAFARVVPGSKISAVRAELENENPGLTTVRSVTEFGRIDPTLNYLNAADSGATLLALFIGTIIVMNTMLLSLIERTREFGILRAIGWSRRRLWALIVGEALLISILGAAIGVGLSFGLVRVLERLPDLRGFLDPQFSADTFFRALYTAAAIGVLASFYPALRAGALKPLAALRRE